MRHTGTWFLSGVGNGFNAGNVAKQRTGRPAGCVAAVDIDSEEEAV